MTQTAPDTPNHQTREPATSRHDKLAVIISEIPNTHHLTGRSGRGRGYTCDICGPIGDATEAIWHQPDLAAADAREYLANEIETLADRTGSWNDAISAAAALIRDQR